MSAAVWSGSYSPRWRAPGHEKTPASRRGSRWFSVVPGLPPRSSVLLPGAGNQAKKAVQPKEEGAKQGQQYDVDEAGLGHGHVDPPAIAGDNDRDVTTILPVDQAHVRLRGVRATAFAVLDRASVRGVRRLRNPSPCPEGTAAPRRSSGCWSGTSANGSGALSRGPVLASCGASISADQTAHARRQDLGWPCRPRGAGGAQRPGHRPPPRPRGHQPAGLHLSLI